MNESFPLIFPYTSFGCFLKKMALWICLAPFLLVLLAFLTEVTSIILFGESQNRKQAWNVYQWMICLSWFCICIGLLYWRSRRKPKVYEIHLWPDRIEWIAGHTKKSLAYNDIVRICFFDTTSEEVKGVLLYTEDKRKFKASRCTPFDLFLQKFVELTVPGITERLKKRIEEGESVAFPEPRAWALASRIVGLVLFLCSISISIIPAYIWCTSGHLNFQHMGRNIFWIVCLATGGTALFRRSMIIRSKGLTISRSGVATIDNPFEQMPWNVVDKVTPWEEKKSSAQLGISIESPINKFYLSQYAENYFVVAPLITSFTSVSQKQVP